MAISSGFFNSDNGDRLYNADTMSRIFDGLISNGVYENVGDRLVVRANSGMTIKVGSGRAVINGYWLYNDSDAIIDLAASDPTRNKSLAVYLRLDMVNRTISLSFKGNIGTAPAKPVPLRTDSYYELFLAYVYVKAGATSIAQTDITDARPDNNVCGWITGVIKQVDTSDLFLQWQTAYAEFYASFKSWFDSLTQTLNVNTYITRYEITKTGTPDAIKSIDLTDIDDYTYETSDIVSVYVNGLRIPQSSYTVSAVGVVTVAISGASDDNNKVTVEVLKSKIGDPVPAGLGGFTFTTANMPIFTRDTIGTITTVEEG